MNPFRHRRTVAMSAGGAGTPFSPLDIPGLVLWLDASQIVGLNDGDPVATWSDLSGNGNDATQGTASQQPTYQTGEINGLPAVQFDGVDDGMALTAITTSNHTAFAVMKRASGGNTLVLSNNVTFGPGALLFYNVDGIFYNLCTTGGGSITSTFSGAGTPLLSPAVAVNRWNGTDQSARINGTDLTRITQVGGLSSGSWNRIGDRPTNPFFHNGLMAEILLYDSGLSAGDIVRVEAYLRNKWGTP
jgi:hypothetical protein